MFDRTLESVDSKDMSTVPIYTYVMKKEEKVIGVQTHFYNSKENPKIHAERYLRIYSADMCEIYKYKEMGWELIDVKRKGDLVELKDLLLMLNKGI